MKKLNETLHELKLVPVKYERHGKVTIVTLNDNSKVVAKKHKTDIYDYLNNRAYNYYPKLIYNKDYDISIYEDNYEEPDEQKILDIIDLVALLHSKTTFYESTSEYDYDSVYRDILGNINYLKDYYDNLMVFIESKEFFSPSEYFLARNISVIYNSLNECNKRLEYWYKSIGELTKHRVVLLHNNLALDHLINNKLISWDKSKIGLPIFDLYKLYKNYYNKFEWGEIIKRYHKKYPLKKEELDLFLLLITMPNKIDLDNTSFNNVQTISKELNYISSTNYLIKELKKDEIIK